MGGSPKGSPGSDAEESRSAHRRLGGHESSDCSDERKAQETLYLLREAEAAAALRGDDDKERVAMEAVAAVAEAADQYDMFNK